MHVRKWVCLEKRIETESIEGLTTCPSTDADLGLSHPSATNRFSLLQPPKMRSQKASFLFKSLAELILIVFLV